MKFEVGEIVRPYGYRGYWKIIFIADPEVVSEPYLCISLKDHSTVWLLENEIGYPLDFKVGEIWESKDGMNQFYIASVDKHSAHNSYCILGISNQNTSEHDVARFNIFGNYYNGTSHENDLVTKIQ